MSGAADAQQLQIEAARRFHGPLVRFAKPVQVADGERAVGNVDVRRLDIDMVEQVLLHEADVALPLVGLHRPVLIQIEGDDVAERQPFALMQADQFAIDAGRRRAGSQPQHAHSPLGLRTADERGNFVGDGGAGGVGRGEDMGRNARAASDRGMHGRLLVRTG